jgi:hypothetical protein
LKRQQLICTRIHDSAHHQCRHSVEQPNRSPVLHSQTPSCNSTRVVAEVNGKHVMAKLMLRALVIIGSDILLPGGRFLRMGTTCRNPSWSSHATELIHKAFPLLRRYNNWSLRLPENETSTAFGPIYFRCTIGTLGRSAEAVPDSGNTARREKPERK